MLSKLFKFENMVDKLLLNMYNDSSVAENCCKEV